MLIEFEGYTKANKSKLAMEMLGYFLTATLIAVFSFAFLRFASNAIIQKSILDIPESTEIVSDGTFSAWVSLACIIASLIVLFAFFLMFAGQKFAYILSINKGVQQLLGGNLSFKMEVFGSDELTELAETINTFSSELQAHREKEELMKIEKDELIKSLSHDIRTPLTSIISYADFMKNEKIEGEKAGEYIEIIQNKARQIQELTDILLSGGGKENCEIVDVKLMMEQFVSEFEDCLEEAGFLVDCKVDMEEMSVGRISPSDINRVFDNLYSNIVKYASAGESVTLRILAKREKVTPEINETFKITIVQKNKVLSNSVKNIPEKASHGIGLKSVKLIAEKYGGHITYKIEKDTFEIEINLVGEKG